MSVEVKPCPFCGGAPVVLPNKELADLCGIPHDHWYAGCKACGRAFTFHYPTREEAVASWNERTEQICEWTLIDDDTDLYCCTCGELTYWQCGEPPNFCPGCGHKIDREGELPCS